MGSDVVEQIEKPMLNLFVHTPNRKSKFVYASFFFGLVALLSFSLPNLGFNWPAVYSGILGAIAILLNGTSFARSWDKKSIAGAVMGFIAIVGASLGILLGA